MTVTLDTKNLRQALKNVADVRAPNEADEPILAPAVRRTLFAWLAEIRAADELKAVGLKPRATALLYGPPGCGKTTLAHHLAARLGIPMVVTGPERLMGGYLGDGERSVAELFDVLAASKTPCLLFLDELEAIAGKRSKNTSGGADNARTSILTVLLRRIEEFRGYCVAATNRKDDIDPAMWRRFHMQISVDLPTEEERFAILRRYAAPFEFDDVSTDLLTALTEGASPALLRGLMEGVKRALVLAPKLRADISDPVAVFATLIAGLAPPPEMQRPPLWDDPEELSKMAWPPQRPEKAA